MGLSYTSFFGPYAVLKVGKGLHLPYHAGEELKIVDVFGFHERLSKGGDSYIVIPNERRKAPRQFYYDPTEEDFIEVNESEFSCGDEKAWFESAFSKELDILKDYYGEHGLSVHWGFLSYIW